MPSPRAVTSFMVHDFDDEMYKTAVDMIHAQAEKTIWLASDCLEELDYATVDSAVTTATAQRQKSSFVIVCERAKNLRTGFTKVVLMLARSPLYGWTVARFIAIFGEEDEKISCGVNVW